MPELDSRSCWLSLIRLFSCSISSGSSSSWPLHSHSAQWKEHEENTYDAVKGQWDGNSLLSLLNDCKISSLGPNFPLHQLLSAPGLQLLISPEKETRARVTLLLFLFTAACLSSSYCIKSDLMKMRICFSRRDVFCPTWSVVWAVSQPNVPSCHNGLPRRAVQEWKLMMAILSCLLVNGVKPQGTGHDECSSPVYLSED